ncbi:hypothetical protein SCHPADRAFT_358528 [Schizopora paradoxa]|uniref:Uncharacterized protein n=1 Tax=Schizopora paradoxa TaxID=27342 RepID=A0A0H2RNT7_9AGAM|nr:hypothetical protein SCHPADRAFT_358528 [Schizopora paradoxa]
MALSLFCTTTYYIYTLKSEPWSAVWTLVRRGRAHPNCHDTRRSCLGTYAGLPIPIPIPRIPSIRRSLLTARGYRGVGLYILPEQLYGVDIWFIHLPPRNRRVKLWLDFLFIAIFDCHIVALPLCKAYQQWKSGLTKHRLVTTIYRDGIGYFIVLFLASTTNVTLLNVESNSIYFDFFILFQRIMCAILASRIVTNVRKAATPVVDIDIDSTGDGHITFGRRYTTGGSLSALTITTVTHKHVEAGGIEMNWSHDGGKIRP